MRGGAEAEMDGIRIITYGQGFMAATSTIREGQMTQESARGMVPLPSSIGDTALQMLVFTWNFQY
jgi:hypothetical protein